MNEREYSLKHSDPHYFIGTKPIAVLFGEERIEVNHWSKVCKAVYERVNQDPQGHADLMSLRNRVHGNIRWLISDSPAGMSKPKRIDDELYIEFHYGTETLLHIMVDCILKYVRYDLSNIKVILKR